MALGVNELGAGYTVFRDGSWRPGTYCLTAGAKQLEKGWREIRKAIRRHDGELCPWG